MAKAKGRPKGKKDTKPRQERKDKGKKRGPYTKEQFASEGFSKAQEQLNFQGWWTAEIHENVFNFDEDEQLEDIHVYMSVKEALDGPD